MKRIWILPALVLFMAIPAAAQEKSSADANSGSSVVPSVSVSPGQVTPTQEMWFYEQRLRQYMDPKMAVRRVAEQRAAQRRARLAATKWYGYSNLRPVACPDPYNAPYSAGWGGNNSLYPELWSGYGPTWVAQAPYYPAY